MAKWFEFATVSHVGFAFAADAEAAKTIAKKHAYGGIEPREADPAQATILEHGRRQDPDAIWANRALHARDRRQINNDDEHTQAVKRADELMGCTEGTLEETELINLVDAIEAYERVRWPEGKEPGGKG